MKSISISLIVVSLASSCSVGVKQDLPARQSSPSVSPNLEVKSVKDEPLLTSNGISFEPKAYYPRFSWDTVPVYMMFGDHHRLLNDAEREKIASESDFICIEKAHGHKTLGDAVLGLDHENSEFKKLKPGIKVLGYLNGALTYPFTRYTKMLTPKKLEDYPEMKAFLVKDPKTGELARTRDLYGFEVLNPDMRAWWSDSAADMVNVTGADGIFIDQMHGFSWLHSKEERAAVAAGVADMMAQLKTKIGPNKMLLANNAARIDAVFEVADAFMFEHYKRKATHTKEKLYDDWQLMKKIADAGKVCVYRFGAEAPPGSVLAEESRKKHAAAWAELSQKQLPFHLAVYLIGAQPYSYFQWGWGWELKTGPLEHYPEFHKPLGPPLGDYTRKAEDQWVFTREFEHASVWVDLDSREGRVTWKN